MAITQKTVFYGDDEENFISVIITTGDDEHDFMFGLDGKNNELFGEGGHDLIIGGNTLSTGPSIFNFADGGTGNDRLFAGDYAYNTLVGGEGNDSLTDNERSLSSYLDGGDGNDTIVFRSANGQMNGGEGNDVLAHFGNGLVNINPGAGRNLVLLSQSATDIIQVDLGGGPFVQNQVVNVFSGFNVNQDRIVLNVPGGGWDITAALPYLMEPTGTGDDVQVNLGSTSLVFLAGIKNPIVEDVVDGNWGKG